MNCQPERVTGYVDGALDAAESALVATHVAGCSACAEQAAAERSLRERLRTLAPPPLPAGLENRVRARLRPAPARRWASVLLPIAATLAVVALWLRGSPAVMAFELAFDHTKCFAAPELPAKVRSHDMAVVDAWFEDQGTQVPRLPAQAAGIELQGARYCPLLDGSSVGHLYYASGPRHVSIFLVPRQLRMAGLVTTESRGRAVRLLSGGGQTIGVVSESGADADAVAAALQQRTARAGFRPFD